nr:immunoglobulin heavy chain junction region [Macaca mulatta]MOV35850.1 immunoglobulin heavy chain junction region [Macaca mulatta]MOV35963.1 immunoglobulin heavy chain junction region [Macaca mulatta]MOV36581.1 immunoglobulin heavy chain junction region [Macaca mulatta]
CVRDVWGEGFDFW